VRTAAQEPVLDPHDCHAGGDVAAASPAAGGRLDRYLVLLRDSLDRLLRAYREAQAAGHATPESHAIACVGLCATPVPGGLPDELTRTGTGLLAGLPLPPETEAIMAAAWWSAADPQVGIAFGWVHDDVARRYPSLAALRILLAPSGLRIPLALPAGSGPVAAGLLRPVADAEAPVRLTATAALLLDGWRPPPEPVGGRLPARLRGPADQAVALLERGHRVVFRCADTDDGPVLAGAVAGRMGRTLLDDPERPRPETGLLARAGLLLPVSAAADPADEGASLRLAGSGAPVSPGWQVIDVAAIDTDGVRLAWRHALSAVGLDTRQAAELAARMRLPEAAVDALRRDAQAGASAQGRHLTVADLHTAVRRHPHHRLDGMARLLPPSVSLGDLVLPEATRDGLRDVLAHARHGGTVSAHWPGVRGRAVVALLHGPSGTGKTAAAEAIARDLDRDLWIADLAQVVSKWLGETSRNLDRLLTEASRSGAVLLFDEAEGLFGRRAEVTDARDRYANLEIDHLLQRIELHEGLVLLTSNRPAAVDDGFQRRLRLSIRFELPDHAARRAIWASLLPAELLAPGITLDEVAVAELSGAGIRAAALSALVFAAADGAAVGPGHLSRAVRLELDKTGRAWTPRSGRGVEVGVGVGVGVGPGVGVGRRGTA
jgi:ATPase family protein associated with various cellular activities (AAA)